MSLPVFTTDETKGTTTYQIHNYRYIRRDRHIRLTGPMTAYYDLLLHIGDAVRYEAYRNALLHQVVVVG